MGSSDPQMNEFGERHAESLAHRPLPWVKVVGTIGGVAFVASLAVGTLTVPLWFGSNQFIAARHVYLLMLIMAVLGGGFGTFARWGLLDLDRRVLAVSFSALFVIAGGSWVYIVFETTEMQYDASGDGGWYISISQSLLEGQLFYRNGYPEEHFGPLYPLYLAPFYAVSRDPIVTKAAILVLGVLALAVVLFTTRKLYGTVEAILAGASLLSLPTLIFASSRNYAEFLAILLYTLTIYCLCRSLEPGRGRYVVLAGLFAGLAYLTKSSTGYFFLIAGFAGLLWRFKYSRWTLFKDRNYLAGMGVFIGLLGAWAIRNIYFFWWLRSRNPLDLPLIWNWDYDFRRALDYTFPAKWQEWILLALVFGAYSVPFIASLAWPFLRQLRSAARSINEERVSLLMVATFLPILLGSLISPIYYLWEFYRSHPAVAGSPTSQVIYFVLHVERYMLASVVPLFWLAFEGAKRAKDKIGVPVTALVKDASQKP